MPKVQCGKCRYWLNRNIQRLKQGCLFSFHYKGKSLVELMELYDASLDEEGTVVNRYDYENVPLAIASRLNLIPMKVANDCISDMFSGVLDQLDKIEGIAKNHRHKTIMGLYTEKPAWT